MDAGRGLTVPAGAVLPTGQHNVVFVDRGSGRLEPRFVELGGRFGDDYAVTKGLAEGERVVSSANFLVDAEAQVQGALEILVSAPDAMPPPSPAPATYIERVIDASARNPFLVIVLTVMSFAGGYWSLVHTPLDAIPDLSDTQVIVYTDWEGRSPDLVEDQITYPIATRFIAAPRVRFVRGESMFGKSFVYVIFEDGTDIYWARSRVIEYLNSVRGSLPDGVNPVIGPDATGVGWVYEYALVDESGQHSLADLRSFQDWHLRYALESVKGVAEVAPSGGS